MNIGTLHNPFYSHLALTIIKFVHLLQTQEISSGHNLQIYQKNRKRHGFSKLKVCEKQYAEQPWIKSICNNQESSDLWAPNSYV